MVNSTGKYCMCTKSVVVAKSQHGLGSRLGFIEDRLRIT